VAVRDRHPVNSIFVCTVGGRLVLFFLREGGGGGGGGGVSIRERHLVNSILVRISQM